MTVRKPPCPVCGDCENVQCQGGGTHGMYRYSCFNIKDHQETAQPVVWQQVPPHRNVNHGVIKILISSTGGSSSGRTYNCSICGQPKKGHVCTNRARIEKPTLRKSTNSTNKNTHENDFDDAEIEMQLFGSSIQMKTPFNILNEFDDESSSQ